MTMTNAARLTKEQAEEITQKITLALDDLLDLVIAAYQGEADKVLGYNTWELYVRARFPLLPRFTRMKRQEAVQKLTDAKMSTREVGAVLGVDKDTVRVDLRGGNPPRRSTAAPKPEEEEVIEVDDTIAKAIELASQGVSFRKIGPQLGVDESIIRRNPMVREAAAKAKGKTVSRVNYTNHLVCQIQEPSEVIARLERTIEDLTGPKYILSKDDTERVYRALSNGIKALEEDNSGTQ